MSEIRSRRIIATAGLVTVALLGPVQGATAMALDLAGPEQVVDQSSEVLDDGSWWPFAPRLWTPPLH